jgi:hypothetical protein
MCTLTMNSSLKTRLSKISLYLPIYQHVCRRFQTNQSDTRHAPALAFHFYSVFVGGGIQKFPVRGKLKRTWMMNFPVGDVFRRYALKKMGKYWVKIIGSRSIKKHWQASHSDYFHLLDWRIRILV